MYTAVDETNARGALHRRLVVLLIIFLLFIAGAIVLFLQRWYIPTVVWTFVVLGTMIFYADNYIFPLRRYHIFLQNILSGQKHEESGNFVEEAEASEKENIPCRVWLLQDEEGEFNIYLDARKNWRNPESGEFLRMQVYQNIAYAEMTDAEKKGAAGDA